MSTTAAAFLVSAAVVCVWAVVGHCREAWRRYHEQDVIEIRVRRRRRGLSRREWRHWLGYRAMNAMGWHDLSRNVWRMRRVRAILRRYRP